MGGVAGHLRGSERSGASLAEGRPPETCRDPPPTPTWGSRTHRPCTCQDRRSSPGAGSPPGTDRQPWDTEAVLSWCLGGAATLETRPSPGTVHPVPRQPPAGPSPRQPWEHGASPTKSRLQRGLQHLTRQFLGSPSPAPPLTRSHLGPVPARGRSEAVSPQSYPGLSVIHGVGTDPSVACPPPRHRSPAVGRGQWGWGR